MKIKSLFFIASLCSLGFLFSCDKDEPAVENAVTYPVSGEWAVKYYVEDGGQLKEIYDHAEILAYNTAANKPTEIWIDDHRTFWDYKVKVSLNLADLSFSGTELQNVSYNSKVTIKEGKVLKNATKINGVQTDSIYFKVSFSDDGTAANPDPYGTDYIAAGHRLHSGH